MEYALGNIYIRQMEGREGFEVGYVVEGHTHNFDHTTIFFLGRWRMRKWLPAVDANGNPLFLPDGRAAWVLMLDQAFDAPFALLIEAGARHEFTFLGCPVPDWMGRFLAKLPDEDAAEFCAEHLKTLGKVWCIYAHRTPQGDVVQTATGWIAAYSGAGTKEPALLLPPALVSVAQRLQDELFQEATNLGISLRV